MRSLLVRVGKNRRTAAGSGEAGFVLNINGTECMLSASLTKIDLQRKSFVMKTKT